ncbi:hypothetical protein IscW_ISCW005862 [Ixodes scapularis]|uniref:Uncharacterized protein n=1 Tax=Ixodes scapularis TaxID=6945 RepID=B7PMN5_IXOSC|nr:hypothetical protein IscW_ISCW005862 [Ixodes scapularis]|eukprot:XP_002435033.1 hypothetical protein IscW_ISCW005862 [Ixodes scapularis]
MTTNHHHKPEITPNERSSIFLFYHFKCTKTHVTTHATETQKREKSLISFIRQTERHLQSRESTTQTADWLIPVIYV